MSDAESVEEGFVGHIVYLTQGQRVTVMQHDAARREEITRNDQSVNVTNVSRNAERIAVLDVRPERGMPKLGLARVETVSRRIYLVHILAIGKLATPSLDGRVVAETASKLSIVVSYLEDGLLTAGLLLVQDGETEVAAETLAYAQRRATQQAEVRLAAVQILSKLGADAPIMPLLRALDDDNWRVRWHAASALANVGKRAPMAPFLAAICDKSTENQGVRIAAAHVLAAHPNDAPVEALVELLHDENDGRVRVAAAWALGQLGERAPIDPLVDVLQHDSAYGIRYQAAWALTQLGKRAPIEPLIEALDEPNVWARTQFAQAALRFRERLTPEAMAKAEAILAEQREQERDMAERERAVAASFERPVEPDTPEGWLAALEHPEWETRAAAVRRLGTWPNETALATILRMLKDGEASVTIAAANALATLGGKMPLDEAVVEALFDRLNDAEDDVEFALTEAIKALAPWVPVESLVTHLGDLKWYSRETAIEALANLESAAPVAPLIAAVGDMDEHIREEALDAFKRTHSDIPEALVCEAEAVLMTERVGAVLGSIVHSYTAREIGRMKLTTPTALTVLMELLDQPYWQVRTEALKALAELAYAVPPLLIERIRTLMNDDVSSSVREAAQEVLDILAEI